MVIKFMAAAAAVANGSDGGLVRISNDAGNSGFNLFWLYDVIRSGQVC
jgi:hypothetical protein